MSAIPRIRGRAGQAAEGDFEGQWFYEISIWDLSGEHQAGDPFQFGPFDSENAACEKGREIVKGLCHALETAKTGAPSDRYLDMKNGGIMRPWDEQ